MGSGKLRRQSRHDSARARDNIREVPAVGRRVRDFGLQVFRGAHRLREDLREIWRMGVIAKSAREELHHSVYLFLDKVVRELSARRAKEDI